MQNTAHRIYALNNFDNDDISREILKQFEDAMKIKLRTASPSS